jgi:hypothetical protein
MSLLADLIFSSWLVRAGNNSRRAISLTGYIVYAIGVKSLYSGGN